jgi:hypothetical protein
VKESMEQPSESVQFSEQQESVPPIEQPLETVPSSEQQQESVPSSELAVEGHWHLSLGSKITAYTFY